MKKHVLFDGRKIVCEAVGQAVSAPLVLLHGFCEDMTVFDAMRPFLPKNGLLLIDLGGFGDSDLPAEPSLEWQAAAVAAVLEAEKAARAVVVGHSMGGYAALAFAERFGERLLGLGLFHSHPFADSEERKKGRDEAAAFVRKNGAAAYVRGLFPKLFAPGFLEKNPETLKKLIEKASKYDSEGIAAACLAMRDRPDRTGILKALACPVLFIVGEKDALETRQNLIGQMDLPKLADGRFLEGIGHMGQIEAPETCAAAIMRFVELCKSTAELL